MTILEKVEIYGYYALELFTDEEVEEYWDMVDGVYDQREQDAQAAQSFAVEYSLR